MQSIVTRGVPAVLAATLLAACSGQSPLQPSSAAGIGASPQSSILAASAAPADAAADSTVAVHVFPDGPDIPGASSTLVRSAGGVSIRLSIGGLAPGAYTAWWVIFDDPSACVLGCGLDDLGVATGLYAAGHVVGNNGHATFAAHLSVGDLSGLDPSAPPIFAGPGLLDPFGAEVHLVVRYHGPAIPGRIPEQTGTFAGGCDAFACGNVAAAAHLVN
jgi:hypothetical protein